MHEDPKQAFRVLLKTHAGDHAQKYVVRMTVFSRRNNRKGGRREKWKSPPGIIPEALRLQYKAVVI